MTTTRILNTARPKLLALASALSLCAGAPVQAQTQTQTPISATSMTDTAAERSRTDRYADAQLAYERNHWPQAFAAFVLLAYQGHDEAARVALLMHRHGPRLYGQHFALTTSQWAFLAAHSTKDLQL